MFVLGCVSRFSRIPQVFDSDYGLRPQDDLALGHWVTPNEAASQQTVLRVIFSLITSPEWIRCACTLPQSESPRRPGRLSPALRVRYILSSIFTFPTLIMLLSNVKKGEIEHPASVEVGSSLLMTRCPIFTKLFFLYLTLDLFSPAFVGLETVDCFRIGLFLS